MSQFLVNRDGGKTSESGFLRFLYQLSSNGQGIAQSGHMAVSQHSTPNASVDIAVGDLFINYQTYVYHTWIDAIYNLTIAANSSGNARIDCVVAYVDLTVVSSASNNNPGALKFMDVQGTPSGSPVAPNGTAIQAAVGAGNPYYILANVAVANSFTNIVNANVTDKRTLFIFGSTTKYLAYIAGGPAVANDISINPQVPSAQTVTTISAHAKTAPVGSGCTVRIWNVTQSNEAAEVTISAGSNDASSTTMVNPSLNKGDVLRVDITAQGSTTVAANITVELF